MKMESRGAAALARELVAAGGSAALATLSPGGGPFASYVVTATDTAGMPLLLLSDLAEHAKNLARDPRASLLFVREAKPGSDTMTATRVTLTGRALKDNDPACRAAYVERHPDAAGYAGFRDFSLYRFDIEAGHLVAGFGRIVPLTRAELLGG
jgi:putative heme iron utilization protein